jgi:hypothetical protein
VGGSFFFKDNGSIVFENGLDWDRLFGDLVLLSAVVPGVLRLLGEDADLWDEALSLLLHLEPLRFSGVWAFDDAVFGRFSSGVDSLMQDSYGLKLDFTAAGEQLVTEEGEDFSLDGSFFLLEFLSNCDRRDFELESAPIWLQVWANSARGLFFESNCNRKNTKSKIKKMKRYRLEMSC